MKRLALILSLGALAPTASAATVTAQSCNASDVQTAISAAHDGDTVLLPANGSCTWSTTVSISTGITLNGQNTSLTMSEAAAPGYGSLSVTANTVASAFITGFKFFGGGVPGSGPPMIQLNTSLSPLTKCYRLYGNTLDDNSPSNTVVLVKHVGMGPGLIDTNTFNVHTGDEIIQNWGTGAGDTSGWTTDVTPGGPNMLFVETNTFNNPPNGPTLSGAINNYYGARIVFRYNNMNDGAAIDAHGTSLNGPATRWFEIYENTFNLPGTQPGQPFHLCCYAQLRGGSGLFYNNHSMGVPYQNIPPGYSFGPNSGSSDITTGPYPINYQTGRGINNTYSPAYVYGNDFLTNGGGPTLPEYVQFGPTPSSSACSANATTGHPGSVCDVVSAMSQPFSLSRCQSAADQAAGCPVTYSYTAYPYPHPLAAGAARPDPPTSLTCTVH
jgi:hypothetical protein